jgi:tripartite-type tricarboxylate transporter receptor subunit TctC
MRTHRWAFLAASLAAAAPPAQAQDAVASFFASRQISLYIGSTPGGGYDSYARLVARHLGDHIPGKPTVIPVNMPGAGSNKLAYFIYAVAPKDGTAMGAIFPGAVMEPLIGDSKVQDDPTQLIYVGSANNERLLCVMRTDAPAQTFKDALTIETRLAASAEGGSSRDFPALLVNILGAKFKIVAGYPGSREMMLAIEQGEVHGECGLGWSSVQTAHPDWIPSGKVRVLVQESMEGHPEVNKLGAPLAVDFARTAEERQILEVMYSQEVFGRPYVVPPGVPADRVAALRAAFVATLTDKETLADAARMRLEVEAIPGQTVQDLIAKIYKTPPAIIARLKAGLIYKP